MLSQKIANKQNQKNGKVENINYKKQDKFIHYSSLQSLLAANWQSKCWNEGSIRNIALLQTSTFWFHTLAFSKEGEEQEKQA